MAFGYNIDQRKINKRNHIIDLFRNNSLLSKADAKTISGYSMDTVISIFDALIDESIIIPSEGLQKPKGRKASFYSLNNNHSLYLGITFNQSGIYSSLVSISNSIIESSKLRLTLDISRDDFFNTLAAHIAEILGRNQQYLQNLKSIGLSIPGDIDKDTGILKSYSFMPVLKDVDFKKFILSHYPAHIPVIDHNIQSMTYYLLGDSGIADNNQRILFVSARTGTANGIIYNKQIVTGHGEFGHIKVSDENISCVCGRTGCLDCYFSYRSFIDLVKSFDSGASIDSDTGKDTVFERLTAFYKDGIGAIGVIGAIKKEFDRRLYYFTCALLNSINITAPDLVILSGELLAIYGDPVEQIRRMVSSQFSDTGISPHYHNTEIIFKNFGTEIAAQGIAYYMINEDWKYYTE